MLWSFGNSPPLRMEKLFVVKLAFRADLNHHVENSNIINAVTGEDYC